MRQVGTGRVARRFVEIEAKSRARDELHLAASEGSNAQFRALQIGHHADRPSGFLFQIADDVEPFAVFRLLAMAEIETENVDPGIE